MFPLKLRYNAIRYSLTLITPLLLLLGCTGGSPFYEEATVPPTSEETKITIPATGKMSVAILYPLTGPASHYGVALNDAMNLALKDSASEDLSPMIIDSGADPEHIKTQVNRAIYSGAKLAIGPLLSRTVKAVMPELKTAHIPAFALTNDQTVTSPNIYAFGIYPEARLRALLSYSISHGIRSFYALLPEGAFGQSTSQQLRESVVSGGASLKQVQLYQDDIDLGRAASVIASSLNQEMKTLAARGDDDFARPALLVSETGDKLVRMLAKLTEAGLNLNEVQLLSNRDLEEDQLYKNASLDGAMFATTDPKLRQKFSANFKASYGYEPPRIAALSYDITLMAVHLAQKYGDATPSKDYLTKYNGFNGVEGRFRLMPDGKVERELVVIQINNGSLDVKGRE